MVRISVLAGIGAGIAAWLYATGNLTDAQVYGIGSALITLSVTALGFLITALSIFAALFTRDLVQRLNNTGHFAKLMKQMFITSGMFLGSTVFGLVCLFAQSHAASALAGTSTGFAAGAIFLLCIVGYRFYLVLSNVR